METAEYLRTEYLTRRDKNAAYSLRAFARDLGVSHTYLSLVFSGKRSLSPSQVAQMGLLLGLSGSELEKWLSHSVRESSATRNLNSKLKTKLKSNFKERSETKREYEDLQIDYARVLGTWYHLALMDATYLKGANSDPAWFAKRLGISAIEANDAIERLKKVEMLEEKKGRLRKTKDFVHLPTEKSIPVVRAYHQSMLKKASAELQKESPDAFLNRFMGGGTLAIKASKIVQAKAKLKKVLNEFITEYAADQADEVYQINLQFFSLTQNQKNSRKE